MDLKSYYTRELAEGQTPVELAVVMQRPGKRGWALYDESLLTDPAKRRRDPDIYLAERAASGDPRIVELPAGSPLWLPQEGKWRPALPEADEDGKITKVPSPLRWVMDSKGKWLWRRQ
jgi:hypothetical protein